MAKIPKKVLNCNTHHACECIAWKLEHYEQALKIINNWSKYGTPSWDIIRGIKQLTDEALHELR